MLALAVVAARPGRPMPDWVRSAVDDPAPDDLPFTSCAHLSWASADGRVRVAAWQAPERLGIGRGWAVDDRGITAFTGLPVAPGRPWARGRPWAVQLAEHLADHPLPASAPELGGLYCVASVGAGGTGTVTADPFGFTSLYRAEGDDVVVAATRAALAARLATPPGRTPARDREAMGWLVLTGAVQEARTGFEAVRRVPEGSCLAIGPGEALGVVTWDPRPWWSGPPASPGDRSELVEQAAAALREQVALGARMPAIRRMMELTGGHDSRLLLAVALQLGVQHEFSYTTWGSPELADVEVAAQLARRYELDHDAPGEGRPEHRPAHAGGGVVRDPLPEREGGRPPVLPYRASVLHHVWATSGGLSAWDRQVPVARPGANVSVSGLFGELLRSRMPASSSFRDGADALAALEAGWLRFDPAGVLRPEVRHDLLRRAVDLVEATAGDGATMQDAFDGYYLRHRLRPWYGAQRELEARDRFFPYAQRDLLRAAFALGPEARRDELLAFTIMRAAEPALATMPFAGRGWPPAVVADRPDADRFPTTPVGASWHATPGWRRRLRDGARRAAGALALRSTSAPWVREEDRQRDFDEHREVLAGLVDLGPTHPLSDLVDRRAVGRAFQRGDRRFANRRTLYDLATAAVWLGGAEARGR